MKRIGNEIWNVPHFLWHHLDRKVVLLYSVKHNNFHWLAFGQDREMDEMTEFLPDPAWITEMYLEWDKLMLLMQQEPYTIIYFTYLSVPNEYHQDF